MTRKDYIAVAKAVKQGMQEAISWKAGDPYTTTSYIVGEIAQVMAKDNANFNPKTFFTACGLSKEPHIHDWDNYGKCVDCGEWQTSLGD